MIKYSTKISLVPTPKKDGTHKIRFRVQFLGNRVTLYLPYSVDADAWDPVHCKCDRSWSLGHVTASMINRSVTSSLTLVDDYFSRCDLDGRAPRPDEVKALFDREKAVQKESDKTSFNQIMDEFISTNSALNSWTKDTIGKFRNLERHLLAYKSDISMDDFNERGLSGFINHLHAIDLRNNYISKIYGFLKWFLKWAYNKGYLKTLDHELFHPRLRGVSYAPKADIYLDWDELMQLNKFEFGPSHRGLDAVRDVFLFCCFTSLRYSDVKNLLRANVFDDHILIVTKKTTDKISINLNDYSRSILERWADKDIGGFALPVISNVNYNKYIKEVCRIAGIDKPTEIVYYKGNTRIEEVHPKYELITTHCGRRTFIVNALSLGVPADVVMKFTGHSDYKAMRPYISIVDSAKADAMDRFNQKSTEK